MLRHLFIICEEYTHHNMGILVTHGHFFTFNVSFVSILIVSYLNAAYRFERRLFWRLVAGKNLEY
jgi:hypothetical protein